MCPKVGTNIVKTKVLGGRIIDRDIKKTPAISYQSFLFSPETC